MSPERSHAIPKSKRNAKGRRSVRVQYGALPFRFSPSGNLEFLVVTSRGRGRWIIPKGWPIKGLKPHESAAREAFEEAGVRGEVAAKSIGWFAYEKILDDESGTIPCEVRVFALKVKRQLKSWPEAGERELLWIDPNNMAALIEEDDLRRLMEGFADRMRGKAASSKAIGKTQKAKVPQQPSLG